MNLWFVASLIKKRNDIADVAWGFGFVLIAWSSMLLSENFNFKPILTNTLVTIWGIRLAWHIHTRNRKRKEDYRYKEWREKWGKLFYIRSYFQIYILQGVFLYSILFPVLFINKANQEDFAITDIIGITIWLIGFCFEIIGDWQLRKFKKDPRNKGKLLTQGLWTYTRHPNYFGEVTLWWGIHILALSTRNGWITITGPLTITVLILFVSGIPLLEKKYAGQKDFEEYKKRTSLFFPLPPKI